ncbi:MAG: segregation/condensation protein A [Chloroflexi bacterium]|nr:segregation/condensation protein A [Chloroflexota bacterium]
MSAAAPPPTTEGAHQLRLQLAYFEGPLELLLSLIEQRRLPITDVSLAEVADQYLRQVYALQELDPDLLVEFLSIASKLLLLKSRALLLNEEPDPIVEETASDLADRLAVYRVFRGAASYLQELEQRDWHAYPPRREPAHALGPAPLAPVVPKALLDAYLAVVGRREEAKPTLELAPRASVDERRLRILSLLEHQPSVSFRSAAGGSVDEVVATFLAILELFRRGRILIDQPATFADLVLSVRAGNGSVD